jgi:hypothetical protein
VSYRNEGLLVNGRDACSLQIYMTLFSLFFRFVSLFSAVCIVLGSRINDSSDLLKAA